MLLNAGKVSIKFFSLKFSFTTSSIDIYDQLSNNFSLPDPLWYPDSGASHHVTNYSSNFNSKSSYTGSEKIKLGNGAGLKITQIGSTTLSTSSSSSSFVLNNLLHVPTVTKNLLSVSQFARDSHVYFEFFPNFSFVKNHETKEILLKDILKEGKYIFPTLQQELSSSPTIHHSTMTANFSIFFSLWHNRMGHASVKTIKRILSQCNIDAKADSGFCDSCAR